MTGNGCAILSLCSIILPRNHYPQLTKSDAQTRETGRPYVPEHVSIVTTITATQIKAQQLSS